MIGQGALLMLLLAQVSQEPYARTHVNATSCEVPQRLAACVYWDAPEVTFQQARGGGATPEQHAAVSQAIQVWRDAFQGCGHLSVSEAAPTDDRAFGWNEEGRNVNTILFRDEACTDPGVGGAQCSRDGSCSEAYDCWDHPDNFLALTISTYACATGAFLDTDIEVNARDFRLTTVDGPACDPSGLGGSCNCSAPEPTCVVTDVMNTMVHELGHAMGLDHTLFPGSTMGPQASPGETHKRTLDEGSLAFVCDVYAPGAPATSCVVRPLEPRLGPRAGGCAAAPWGPGLGAVGLLGLWLSRRRRG